MREKTIEQKFVAAVRNAGGLSLKFTSPGWDGVPDGLRIIGLSEGWQRMIRFTVWRFWKTDGLKSAITANMPM